MTRSTTPGRPELRKAVARNWPLFSFVAVFSFFLNILMLTGAVFMLQVYDRVLASRSVETLVALTLLVVFLFIIMGVLDYTRGRVLMRIATRLNLDLSRRVFSANLVAAETPASARAASNSLGDLDRVRRLVASPVASALFDLPFTPFFLLILFLFHPALGGLALAGGGLLVLMSILNQVVSSGISRDANDKRITSMGLSNRLQSDADTLRGLGMQDAAFDRWYAHHVDAQAKEQALGDRQSKFTTFTKTFRQLLQSLMLALGAWLVLRGELTAGAMIAGSILMGRALQPVELIVGQWALMQGAAQSWARLGDLLTLHPNPAEKIDLPHPKGHLRVESASVVPPGGRNPTLRGVAFDIRPGEVLGVIGGSGSGKTSLARLLTASWLPISGTVRLDGASIQQYRADRVGQFVGYLPQNVRLFDGTVGENIARLQSDVTDDSIIAAAKKARAHDMIVRLPMGYQTPARVAGSQLSGGQMQRIGLARALYGNPSLLVLDEPDASLDSEGSQALEQAIATCTAEGHSVVVMTHRSGVLRLCDKLLILNEGRQVAFGPRDEVMKKSLVVARSGNAADRRPAKPAAAGQSARTVDRSNSATGAISLRHRAGGPAAASAAGVADTTPLPQTVDAPPQSRRAAAGA